MSTASPAGLDVFLNNFRSQVDSGFGLISGDVQSVLATLVVISIVTTAILWAIDENQNVLAALVRKVLLIGFFTWLVTQWHSLSQTVVEGFASLGLKAGGGAMSLGDFLNSPSKIVMKGIEICIGLFDYIHRVAPGPVEFFAHIDVVLMALIACIGVLIAFVILAIEVTVVVIEFHIVTLIAFVTVPFGILTQTSFLSERAIGYVVSVGIKLMALAIVISIGTTIFDAYTVSADPDIYEDVGLLLGAVVMVMLALKIPAIAGALISGGPQLNAGSALMGAAGVAAGVAGVGLAARMAGGAIAQGAAAGGAKVAAARAASGGLSSGGGALGGGGGPSPSPSQGPGPTPSPASASRSAPASDSSGPSASRPETPASDAGSTSPIVARAQARRSGLGSAARTSAATAAASGDSNSPGMSASPIRPDDEPKS
ncbi:P-type conjugative transfer protein TrbL [Phenylobacterium sp.]|jgi:type IV secretion system protein TrbL|uniref:P-type conjugative transfer protein TrbL n=1 Tax=Phenylobacterium sp. TaxID=1871053 RepID=UPI0037CC27BC